MHIFQLAIEKMVWHFSVGQKTAEMTSKMGGYSVNICASTRADICILAYIKKNTINGSALRNVIDRDVCIVQKKYWLLMPGNGTK